MSLPLGSCISRAAWLPLAQKTANTQAVLPIELVSFTHSVPTQANAIKFSHQLLCNPKISFLLKALRKGFLIGCPNIGKELVTKYLNPSPATAKGHMKRPKKGIRSTKPKSPPQGPKTREAPVPVPQIFSPVLPVFDAPHPFPGPAYGAHHNAHMIPNNKSIANVFCVAAFTDKISWVVYNDLTVHFLFMSIDGSVCFFVMYHIKTNAILAKPIANLDDHSIFDA
jgi:hypothetical protein